MNNACKLELIYMYMYLAIQKRFEYYFSEHDIKKKPTMLIVKEDSKNKNSKNIIHYLNKLPHLCRQKQVYKVYI